GGVNTTRDYAELMTFGHWTGSIVHVDKPLLQGGIVAVYYLPGTLIGALWGGWLGDRYGRIFTIAFATLWAIVGAALQCSAMNADWMFCARVFNGVGTGILNAITPVWATETASHTSRGAFVALEFTLNIFGVVVAYWLEYGTSFYGDGTSGFIWRFPIAFQIVPLLALLAIVWWMPESPRWLVKVGRDAEARFILGRLRGEAGDDEGLAEAEFQDIKNICRLEQENSQQSSYVSMLLGLKQGKLHTARRVQLVVWLQILQEWIGIAGITIYGPTIFTIAGIAPADRQWFATLICVFTLDRIGRRWTLWWGAAGQAITLFCAGGLAYATQHSTGSHKEHVGGAAVFFVFLYTAIFGATWLTVPWLYPAEIFPLQIRAKGNAWGVIGWSIGNGWTVLLLPTIFERLNEKTLYVFGAVNIFAIGVVWAFYPESNQRTLEEMNLVFAADSVWTWDAEKHFAKLKEQNPDLVRAARRGSSVGEAQLGMVRRLSVEENEKEGARRVSLAAVAEAKDL
ncbi:general substrate transporter, partial [Hortaea werneckii]